MVVRGAPAIAIAAALSLAVEVSKLQAFDGTPDNAASFLIEKLEYLVTRYFVMNLRPSLLMTSTDLLLHLSSKEKKKKFKLSLINFLVSECTLYY